MDLNVDVFGIFDKKWALLTAGNTDKYNTMTVSWGGLGTLWNRPVATVYVRTSRYTHEFMDDNEFFTLSFFGEEYKKTLGLLGSESGRDIDKMHVDGLTAVAAGESVTFGQAEMTLVCRKLFVSPLDTARMPEEIASRFYSSDAPHDMYIGEVVDILYGQQ